MTSVMSKSVRARLSLNKEDIEIDTPNMESYSIRFGCTNPITNEVSERLEWRTTLTGTGLNAILSGINMTRVCQNISAFICVAGEQYMVTKNSLNGSLSIKKFNGELPWEVNK